MGDIKPLLKRKILKDKFNNNNNNISFNFYDLEKKNL